MVGGDIINELSLSTELEYHLGQIAIGITGRHIIAPWSERIHCMESRQSFFLALLALLACEARVTIGAFAPSISALEKKRLFCSLDSNKHSAES